MSSLTSPEVKMISIIHAPVLAGRGLLPIGDAQSYPQIV